ncbi:MAG: DUF1553 domain-containing protein, partial [Planctomycetaceae bacterium]|nr:DUF1553 domain-containing protein [Planctomycetaceae bacterium]
RRSATTTPLQALTLMNHDFTLDMADALAARVAEDTGEQPNDQIERAFVLAFGRAPDPNERDTALPLVKQHELNTLCRVLLNANEFIYLE